MESGQHKTRVLYEAGKALEIQGDGAEILACCSQIIVQLSNASGKSVDEISELCTKIAKNMKDGEKIRMMRRVLIQALPPC